MILTANAGAVPVEELDPAVHRLVSFDPIAEVRNSWLDETDAFNLAGRTRGFRFEIREIPFSGDVRHVEVDMRAQHFSLSITTTTGVPWLLPPEEDCLVPRAFGVDDLRPGTSTIGISPNHETAYWETVVSIERIAFEGPVFEIGVERFGVFIANNILVYGGRIEDES